MNSNPKRLLEQLADTADAGIPLHVGLRAAADEASDARLGRVLREIARQLESGKSLDEAMRSTQPGISPLLLGAVRAGTESGQLGQVLTELIECEDARRRGLHDATAALFYPLVLLVLTTFILAVVLAAVIPSIHEIFDEFDVDVPMSTQALFWVCDVGWQFAVGLLAISLVGMVVGRLLMGRGRFRWFLGNFPIFGPLLCWNGVVEFSRLWRVLVRLSVPSPQALRLTSDAVRDPNMGDVARVMASSAKSGTSLARQMEATGRVPLTLVPLIAWGERENRLDDALEMAAEVFEGRIRLRARFLSAVLPPLVFTFVAATTAGVVIGVLLPLVTLLNWF